MTTKRRSSASDQADALRAHASALEAHAAALERNTQALLTHHAAMAESIERADLFSTRVGLPLRSDKTDIITSISTMNFGDTYHESDCINGLKEVWSSDGLGGLRKDYKRC